MFARFAALAVLAHAVSARVHLDWTDVLELEQQLEEIRHPVELASVEVPLPEVVPAKTEPKPDVKPVEEKPAPVEEEEEEKAPIELPAFFDHRTVWWGCGQTVHNQGQCGSCWANSAISVLNDRFCIHKDINDQPLDVSRFGAGAANRAFQEAGSCDKANSLPHDHGCTKRTTILSPQRVVSCASMTVYPKTYNDSAGCNGGNAQDAWHYFHAHGVSTMSGDGRSGCSPYVSGMCLLKDPHNNGCLICEATSECQDSGLAPQLYKVGDYGKIRDPGLGPYKFGVKPPKKALENQIRMMKEEIMTNGPIQSCFAFPEDFQKFFNEHPLGIYNSTKGVNISGSHCVTLTGWGRDAASGMDHWIIRNSWGDQFGTRGYYRWKMGDDLCGIEHESWTGCPLGATTCKLTDGVQVATPDDRNMEDAVPWNANVNDISFGGKWMDHDGTSSIAQRYAHQLTKHQVDRGHVAQELLLSPGDYQVKTVQTKVTNGVVARVVMTMPGTNGEVEAIMHHHWDDSYSVVDISSSL